MKTFNLYVFFGLSIWVNAVAQTPTPADLHTTAIAFFQDENPEADLNGKQSLARIGVIESELNDLFGTVLTEEGKRNYITASRYELGVLVVSMKPELKQLFVGESIDLVTDTTLDPKLRENLLSMGIRSFQHRNIFTDFRFDPNLSPYALANKLKSAFPNGFSFLEPNRMRFVGLTAAPLQRFNLTLTPTDRRSLAQYVFTYCLNPQPNGCAEIRRYYEVDRKGKVRFIGSTDPTAPATYFKL